MSKVGQKDTKPEVLLRKALWACGLRYRKHRRIAGIRPDLVLGRFSLAIFVDGCFWHGCPKHYSEPESNAAFWREKVERNRQRDRSNEQALIADGWRVLRIWECEIENDLRTVVAQIRKMVKEASAE